MLSFVLVFDCIRLSVSLVLFYGLCWIVFFFSKYCLGIRLDKHITQFAVVYCRLLVWGVIIKRGLFVTHVGILAFVLVYSFWIGIIIEQGKSLLWAECQNYWLTCSWRTLLLYKHVLFRVAYLSKSTDPSFSSRVTNCLQIRFWLQFISVVSTLPAALALQVNLRIVLIHHFCIDIIYVRLTVIVLLGQTPIIPTFSDGKTQVNCRDYS